MLQRFISLAMMFQLIGCASAVKPVPQDRLAERLKAIQADVADAETAAREAEGKLPEPQLDRLRKTLNEKRQNGWADALQIAKADPTSEVGFDAMEWILMVPNSYMAPTLVDIFEPQPGKTAIEWLTKYHAENPRIGKTIATLTYYPPQSSATDELALNLMNAVVENNPDRTARAQAAFGLAMRRRREYDRAVYRQDQRAADRAAAEAQQALEAVVKEYGDCPNQRAVGGKSVKATLAEEAAPELYELEYLRIGLTAPEIQGKDLNGVQIKLNDYHGKVILLVFWASWCGPCMSDVPHERELVEHFQGRPFVLLGVNGDSNKDDALKIAETSRISWRSFWNGGANGPIVGTWNVSAWPTVYVIDSTGKIRYKDLRGKALDAPLEKLVAETESSRPGR